MKFFHQKISVGSCPSSNLQKSLSLRCKFYKHVFCKNIQGIAASNFYLQKMPNLEYGEYRNFKCHDLIKFCPLYLQNIVF